MSRDGLFLKKQINMPRPKEVAGGADMQVWVETYAGHGGVEMPRRFRLGGREIEVIENLDQWYSAATLKSGAMTRVLSGRFRKSLAIAWSRS